MKTVTRIIQFLLGALFLFSGFVKAVDPLGTSYKMHDYFTSFQGDFPKFNWLWNFMLGTSTMWAVIMLVFELVLGLALIIGWRPKLTLWLTLLLMFFFTFLTGYTYLSGYTIGHWYYPGSWVFHDKDMKVTDCGCFGDFMKLKPYTSFYKDVVIDILVLILLIWKSNMYTLLRDRIGNMVVGLGTVGALWFCFSNYLWGLPMIDFRPYAVGKSIPEGMKLPPGAKKDSVQMVFIYEKDGKKLELNMEQLKTIDGSYKFIDRKDKMIVEGDHAPIHDFTITSADGTDVTQDVLGMDNVFLLVAYEIDKSNGKVQSKVNDFVALCQKAGIEFIGLTASNAKEIDIFRHEHNSMFDYYGTDGTTLKTMIRSNPGLMLLKKGTVTAIWHYHDFPTFDEVKQKYLNVK
jgi:uncharacterized membrane protein YphA (DoxX/SURF4 family)/peroxiredoxin